MSEGSEVRIKLPAPAPRYHDSGGLDPKRKSVWEASGRTTHVGWMTQFRGSDGVVQQEGFGIVSCLNQRISLSGSWNPPDQTRTNTELVRLDSRVGTSVYSLPYFFSLSQDGVGGGATTTQCFGHHFPGFTEQEPRCETAGR